MGNFYGVEVSIRDFTQGAADIKFPPAVVAFGTSVVGLHFTGNGTAGHLMSLMEVSVQFPVTIHMPCGWTVIVPTLKSTYRNILCPCGSGLHWIVKWDNK